MSKKKVTAPATTSVKPTKKSLVLAMLREGGVSVAQIAEKLEISPTAAYSLISDLKRAGVKVSGVVKDGKMHYSAVPERTKAKAARTFGKGASVSAAPSSPTASN